MKVLTRNPILTLTILGLLLREALILAGVSYDSGGFKSILYFLGEGLSILIIAVGDLLDYVFSTRTVAHHVVSLLLGLLAAFLLDRIIGKLRKRFSQK